MKGFILKSEQVPFEVIPASSHPCLYIVLVFSQSELTMFH